MASIGHGLSSMMANLSLSSSQSSGAAIGATQAASSLPSSPSSPLPLPLPLGASLNTSISATSHAHPTTAAAAVAATSNNNNNLSSSLVFVLEEKQGWPIDLFELSERELAASDLICAICHGILRQAVQTANGNVARNVLPCGHLFCTHCITRWLQTSSTCPLCKSSLTLDQLHHDINIRRKVATLRVRCHIDPKQCTVTSPLGSDTNIWWQEHDRICGYKRLACVICNHITCERRDMNHHMRVTCTAAIVPCDYCQMVMARRMIDRHKITCQWRPTRCDLCDGKGNSSPLHSYCDIYDRVLIKSYSRVSI
jgi:hypothetical protein